MSNAQGWIDATRQRLMSGHQEQLNRLDEAYVAGSGTMKFTFGMNGIRQGSTISIGTSTFYVWDVSPSLNTATVQSAWDGTNDADFDAGAIVRISPRFTDAQILTALNEDINDLCSPTHGLYQIASAQLEYSTQLVGYDLAKAPNLLSILELRIFATGGYKDWPRVPNNMYRVMKGAPTGDDGFNSGNALFLYGSGYGHTNGNPIHITYRKSFNTVASPYSSKSGTGIPQTAWDLPPLGAAISLMAGREIKRSFIEGQGDSKRATEVSAGASLNSVRGLQLLRQNRIEAEKQRLDAFYPIIKDA